MFSSLVLVFVALISLWSFLLLVQTKFVVSGSFGGMSRVQLEISLITVYLDIGGALYGPYMRIAILTSITVSQLGFVSAYTIFVAENLRVGHISTVSVRDIDVIRRLSSWLSRTARRSFLSSISS